MEDDNDACTEGQDANDLTGRGVGYQSPPFIMSLVPPHQLSEYLCVAEK